ncbi:hypothetical protein [Actinoplanes friuliensis]|uniref:Uncharacterized protein n=1 Tax=Actinoplanes friuliensis DSM 7358 TaxID=1246995 RepID=U5W4G5_9ACTN|nr:hypothetical protein [Actinoplanes friuliensis]AGZ42816.1 hypothetical protein AFR_22730 [Actinoplanes friuliensis DSM 7358]
MDDDVFPRTGADVVRQVLAALAPGELPYVASVLEAYRVDPWTLDGREAGIPADQVNAWAPFVLGFVAGTVVAPAEEPVFPAGRGRLSTLVQRFWRPRLADLAGVPDTPVPALAADELRRVWAAAIDAATLRGCSARDREAFAAAVVAALAVGHLPN